MLNYVFNARNSEGTMTSGSLSADSRTTAVTALKQKGYYLLNVEPESKIAAFLHQKAGFAKRVGVKARAIFTRQLATMLKAGIQLTPALETLSKQTQDKYLSRVIKQLHSDVEQSSSLSEAMAKHPTVFSSVYAAIVAAAEEAGNLAETLSVLSRQLKAQASVNSRIKAALVYPVFLLVVSAGVICVLTIFVIPKFIELFVSANQNLPLPTRILVGTTDFLRDSWWMFVFAIAGVLCLSLTALRNERVRLSVDVLLLKVPVVGTLNRRLQLARFARTLGSLLDGGVRIISAVNTTKAVTANTAFAREVANIEESILGGATMAKAVKEQEYFGEIAADMIEVGEETGTLPEALFEVADMHDQECESAISSITSLLEPVIIVVLGVIIGFVVMAILMPIFEASTMVS